jgi:hypothetical protein
MALTDGEAAVGSHLSPSIMKHVVALCALAVGVLGTVGCAPIRSGALAPTAGLRTAGPFASAPAANTAPAPTGAAGSSATQPPLLNVSEPMPGAPAAAALSEARLVQGRCENAAESVKQRAQALIREMHDKVDAQYAAYQQRQPECWRQYRENEEYWRQIKLGQGWVGQGFSATGAGCGAISTGQGYGSGDGRLGGSHVTLTPRAAASASKTNNQVASVDEADIVKTDGRYVYLLLNGALRILDALKPRVLSVTKFSGEVKELFVEGDRAVVYVSQGGSGAPACQYGYDCTFAGDGSSTRLIVLDVSDRRAPKVRRQLDFSGSLLAARRIGNAVHTVLSDRDVTLLPYQTWFEDLPECGVLDSAVKKRVARLKERNESAIVAATKAWFPTIKDQGRERALCDNLWRTQLADGDAFTTLVSFDVTEDALPVTATTLQSRPGAVFASAGALYLSVPHQRASSQGGRWYSFYPAAPELSEIHKFQIGPEANETRYLGSGVVQGHVLNQFALDEWHGYLRVATTRGRVPEPGVESALTILAAGKGGNLVQVGSVEHLAPGEDIRAVRFDDDRGYLVTFKKTDPLFVLDLQQPAHPVLLGELEIPGFSTYLQRIDAGRLLSIGFDANDEGDFANFDGLLLQLFDVRSATEPKLLFRQKIGTRGSSSEAALDHLAFNYFAEKSVLAIPATVCDGGGDGANGSLVAFSGLLLYAVDAKTGFTRLGGIDHGAEGGDCSGFWSHSTSAVKRSVFLGDLVYSIATDRVKVQKLDQLGRDVADLAMTP